MEADPTEETRFALAPREDDDAAEIRYSLTALGEAAVGERIRRVRFRGFGPCRERAEVLLTLSNRL